MAARLFHVCGAAALPLWADSGSEGRHVLAAWPTRAVQLRVATLGHGELTAWLREQLAPRGSGPAGLRAVLLSYDAGRNLEHVAATAAESPLLPDVVLAEYPAHLVGETGRGPWRLVGEAGAASRLAEAIAGADAGPAAGPGADAGVPSPRWTSSMSPQQHAEAVETVRRGIAAGDYYQVNVARRLQADCAAAHVPAYYRRLRGGNPARYGALWHVAEATWLGSSSPECLFTYDAAAHRAHSYPIKGTRPRGRDAAEDAALVADLVSDPKERAEHVMIVDLVRHDLGRVATTGGVRVGSLFEVMTLPTVHHLVSDVVADLAPDRDLADLIAALFPGGSITGAPKIAAMEAIEAVEGLRRGWYTGSLGLVFPDGSAVFNILIRTVVARDGRLYYATGGGIVADSEPAAEWAETEIKAASLQRATSRPGAPGGRSTP